MKSPDSISTLRDAVGAPSCLDDERLIRAWQMTCARAAIKLEQKGLRHSRLRGGAKRSWAKHFGMPANASHDDVMAKLTEEINKLKKEVADERAQQQLHLD